MLKGKIKLFIEHKKIGFIVQEDQTDLFFAKKQLQEGYTPQKNDIVAYEIQPSLVTQSFLKQGSFEAKNIIFLKEETEKMKETAKEEELEKEQNIQKERQKDLEKIEVLHGKIEWFNAPKGFGVIQSDKLGGVFFHISNLGDCSWIEKNTPVKFRVTEKKNAPIDRKYTVISLEVDTLDLFIYANTSYHRKNIFDKLNQEQQQGLLDDCQKNCDDEKLYLLWKEGYNLIPSVDFLSQKFMNNSIERESIFRKLTIQQQKQLLDYCQKNCDDEKLYLLWKQEYNIPYRIEYTFQEFILEQNQRKTIFEKLNPEQQQELLEYCQENCDEDKIYELLVEGYEININFDILYKIFLYKYIFKEFKNIFENLNLEQQQDLLTYCQKNCDDEELYLFWKEDYNLIPSVDFLSQKFINPYYSSERKDIFENLNIEQQKSILDYCQKNCDNEKLYIIWKEGYNLDAPLDAIFQVFINTGNHERKHIFEKLDIEQQKSLLDYCQKNCDDEKLYELWKEGYVPYQVEYTFQRFILDVNQRKTIFEKLSPEQKQALLDYCQENCTLLQKLDLWIENFFTEIPDGVLDGLMTQEKSELWNYIEENITDDKKISLKQAFANYEDYDILLWTYGIIKDFDFDVYAHNYFLLNRNNKRKFTKKAKLELRQELNTKLLNSLEGCDFIKEEDGLQIYEASWRSVWYQNKSIRICIDASEARFTRSFFWDYAHITFNYLATYISGRRVAPLQVYLNGNQIVKIEGLPLLEEVLYKAYITREVKDRNSNKDKAPRMESEPKFPQNIILKNVCLQYLNLLQIPDLIPVQVHEYTLFDIEKSNKLDISTLYSIKLPNEEVAVIWESTEFEKSKATHIFKFYEDDYQIFFDNIKKHIEDINFLRSRLRSKINDDVSMQTELSYLGNIDHSNFDFEVWRKSLHKLLPTLPTIDYQNIV